MSAAIASPAIAGKSAVAELVAERSKGRDEGWLRGADAIADYVGSPRSRICALATTTPPRIPVERDGSSPCREALRARPLDT